MGKMKEQPRVPINIFPTIIFIISVVFSISLKPNTLMSEVMIGLLSYLFIRDLFTLLIKRTHNRFLNEVVRDNPKNLDEVKKIVEMHKEQRRKEFSVVATAGCFGSLFMMVSLVVAFQIDDVMMKSFILTNIIFSFYLINARKQIEMFFERLFLMKLPRHY